jgi:hypothetical protein
LTVVSDSLALLFSHMYLSGKRLLHSKLEHATSASSPKDKEMEEL